MSRGLTRTRAMLVVGVLGVLLVVTSLPTWGRAEGRGTAELVPIALAGTDAVPAVPSAGLVVLVAALVLGLSGRATRIAAVVGAAFAGLLAGWSTFAFLRNPEPPLVSAAGEATRVREIVGPVALTAWPVVAIAVAVVVVLVTAVLPWQFGRWAAVGRRYERGPAAGRDRTGPRSPRLRAMDDWDAIGRGDDPSVDSDR